MQATKKRNYTEVVTTMTGKMKEIEMNTGKTVTEAVKSTVQTITVSVAVLALAWAPFLASA